MLLKFLIVIFLSINSFAVKFLVTGSSTIAPIVEEVSRLYEKDYPGALIDVQTGGSTRGIVDIRNASSDIGMVSRALKDTEKDVLGYKIGLDGIGVIVHHTNKVSSINSAQLLDIYLGKITNWKEIGGDDAKIVVVNKAEGRSTLELFCHFLKIKNSDIRAHIVIGDNEQGVKTVLAQKYSIGYVSIGTAEVSISAALPLKLLKLDDVVASTETVKDGSYPLSRELNLVTGLKPKKEVLDIINYVISKKEIINGLGFVALENIKK